MSIFEKLDKALGGYIFLSHAHKDIEKVRNIRNILEANGFEPLCFYLKCLDDDSEVEDLIKREIDAREWFVFLDSENSRNSKWVSLEREYITKTNKKKIITINLDDTSAINNRMRKITHGLRTFLAYSKKDATTAKAIQRRLAEKDYLVYDLDKISSEIDWAEAIADMLAEVAESGITIALITDDFLHSQWAKRELPFVLDKGGKVIPIFIGNTKPSIALQLQLSKCHPYYLPKNPNIDEIDKIIDSIGKNIIENNIS